MKPDHPRIRGEHGPGNRSREDAVGIIPAYAGSTPTRASGTNRRWDHPRIRGEHGGALSSPSGVSGSSPHTRGALTQYTPTHYITGIIPAYAGSTTPTLPATWRRTDHPRIRGEHRWLQSRTVGGAGSSPHTRGAPEQPSTKSPWCRIIPAYAGSTSGSKSPLYLGRDHPRIRGEHRMLSPGGVFSAGSSPHTRGALAGFDAHLGPERIIPAYAGSTSSKPCRASSPSDHPRIRGEHQDGFTYMPEAGGSSPHTRGALPDNQRHDPKGEDHPRIRGEHSS